jgi:hypothetical protein
MPLIENPAFNYLAKVVALKSHQSDADVRFGSLADINLLTPHKMTRAGSYMRDLAFSLTGKPQRQKNAPKDLGAVGV